MKITFFLLVIINIFIMIITPYGDAIAGGKGTRSTPWWLIMIGNGLIILYNIIKYMFVKYKIKLEHIIGMFLFLIGRISEYYFFNMYTQLTQNGKPITAYLWLIFNLLLSVIGFKLFTICDKDNKKDKIIISKENFNFKDLCSSLFAVGIFWLIVILVYGTIYYFIIKYSLGFDIIHYIKLVIEEWK